MKTGPSQPSVPSCGKNTEELSAIVVDCAYKLHAEAGPGLLETVYEVVLAKMLEERGVRVRRQVPVPIVLMGLRFDEGFRADLIVEDQLLIELKSVENLAPVHAKQVLTYLRLLHLPLGLLINFGAATFKEGCKRIVNGQQSFASSRLRVNQTVGDD
ncbi:MAG: GxxExxY protein [Terrimicrobiaceae bacterium]